jgi:hypothetical protein
MKVTRTGSDAFTVEFESEQELRDEERANLSVGGLRLGVGEPPALHSRVVVTLRAASGTEATVRATVVAPLPDGVALAIEGDPRQAVETLLAPVSEVAEEAGEERDSAARQNILDRIRSLSRTEKLFLAAKADRVERAFLVQDTDPQILGALLRNPRITIEEVVRIAKSSHLIYQTVDVIMKTGQWFNNLDVRVALIHNPKTPPQIALRILPTLPESEVRAISRGDATSMALKTAALRRLQQSRT